LWTAPDSEIKETTVSHYSEVQIEFRDGAALVAALERLGFKGKVEVHQEAKALYGYQGDKREQQAHIIIRREHVGEAANDIGFQRQSDGTYRAWISEFDQTRNSGTRYDGAWVGRLKQSYGIEKAKAEAKKKGYRVTEQKQDDGRVRLVCRR
jgi:hypothetical protein